MSLLNQPIGKLFLIVGLLMLVLPFMAAGLESENMPKTPTAVPTETDAPALTATATITPTITATITPTTTVSPTASLTPTMTLTPTLTATISPTPTATLPSSTPKSWKYLTIVQHNFMPTPTPSPTPIPTSEPNCQDVIKNGGFENSSDWIIGNNAYPASYSMVQVHSGSRSMRTGIISPGDNRESYSSAWQFVPIPANAQNATLTFWLYPVSSGVRSEIKLTPPAFIPTDISQGVHANDVQLVLIFDQNGTQHNLVYQRSNGRIWTAYQFDVSPFAGQTIQLYFGVYNNGYAGVTGMYVDDVALLSCTTNP